MSQEKGIWNHFEWNNWVNCIHSFNFLQGNKITIGKILLKTWVTLYRVVTQNHTVTASHASKFSWHPGRVLRITTGTSNNAGLFGWIRETSAAYKSCGAPVTRVNAAWGERWRGVWFMLRGVPRYVEASVDRSSTRWKAVHLKPIRLFRRGPALVQVVKRCLGNVLA